MFVVYQRPAAKLTAAIEHNRHPRPLVRIGVLTANDALLVEEGVSSTAAAAIECHLVDDRRLGRNDESRAFGRGWKRGKDRRVCGISRPDGADRRFCCPSRRRSFRR